LFTQTKFAVTRK